MLTGILACIAMARSGPDLLPDVFIWETQTANSWYIGTTNSNEAPAGRRCIRFSATTANIGTGPVDLRGGSSYTDPVLGPLQHVNQRIYQSNGAGGYTFYERLAGDFVFHPTHGHLHFQDWTTWRLRKVNPDGSAGDIVSTGTKTSFCIIETTVYNSSLPGFNESTWSGYGCGEVQGTRPGRADTYGSSLDGQYIDLTGIPDGTYWVEGTVNPAGKLLESNYDNNSIRFPVTIGNAGTATADRFEPNDTTAQVDAKPEHEVNSANLGLVNKFTFLDNLSMTTENVDYYKFRLNRSGSNGNYVRLESSFVSGQGLNFYLLDSNGNTLSSLTDSYNVKQISIAGRPAGTYYLKVTRQSGQNPRYMLTINPAAQLPPQVTFTNPNGNVLVEKAHEYLPVTWTCNDPEGDPKTLGLLYDTTQTVGSSNVQLSGYENLAGGDNEANVNTAQIPVGTYYIIGRASDGGAQAYSFSPGTFTVYVKGDLDGDGTATQADWALYKGTPANQQPSSWTKILDMDRDGDVDRNDLKMFSAICNGG